jgi:protein-disulfide isomerase
MSQASKLQFDKFLLLALAVSMLANFILAYRLRQIYVQSNAQEAAVLTANEMAELSANDAPSLGNQNAPVTMIVFTDFQCPYCRNFASTLRRIESGEGNKLRVVVRELPLPMHKYARKEAELSLCVANQSTPAFWSLYDYLYDQNNDKDDLTDAGLAKVASRADINSAKLYSCVQNHQASSQVDHDVKLASKYSVTGTPTIFVNGTRVIGELRKPDNLIELIRGMAKAR